MSLAYACRIRSENYQAIASEKPHFELADLREWIEMHGSGYFIREEGSSFDCTYMVDEVFSTIYCFTSPPDVGGIFRPIERI